MTRVAVVGVGVMGCAAAWALSARGADVTILEQFDLDHTHGSSHGRTRIFRLAYPDAHWVQLAQEALRGWRELGESVSALLAAHPGLTLLADDREILAALIYYVRPHPFGAVEWNPIPGITDQWRLVNNIANHQGDDFLAVTVHNLADQMRPDFAELTPLTTIATHSGPGGGGIYTVYIARGFRGSGRRYRKKPIPIKLHRVHPLPNPPKPSPNKGEGLYQHPYLYSRPLDGGGSGWG